MRPQTVTIAALSFGILLAACGPGGLGMREPLAIREEPGPLFPAMKGERMGYINRDGEWVIPPRLLTAHPFQGDVAVVRVRMRNGHGLIDRGGPFV